ncbi:MAG: APC family permease [Terriglobia bacterium]
MYAQLPMPHDPQFGVTNGADASSLPGSESGEGLIRGLGLKEATAANVVEMVGIGPFITIPILLTFMGGPQALLGWLVGALLAVSDGMVWAELGASMPGAGGSYRYLREAYGANQMGLMMSFLFVWMILFTAPLSAATGAVGFAEYLQYLVPNLSPLTTKVIAVAVVLAITALLYRNIKTVGRLSFWLMLVVLGSILWVILSGLFSLKLDLLLDFPRDAFSFSKEFFVGLGSASLIAIYGYGGYNNVCFLGGEVKEPSKNIPRAIVFSILLVAVLYFFMTVSIIGVVPWREAMQSPHVVSDFMELIYGSWAGRVLTVLILGAAFASVFALLLGYTRIPYAAAADGRFFRVFARLHPTQRFPHVSVILLGLVSTFFCFFELEEIIQILMVIQIIVLYLAQVFAVTLIRRRSDINRPFQMWLYPLPSFLAAGGWLYILFTQEWRFIAWGVAVLGAGIGLYLLRAKYQAEWPFAPAGETYGGASRGGE